MVGIVLFLGLLLVFFYFFDVRARLKSLEERLAKLERKPPESVVRDSAPAEPSPTVSASPEPSPDAAASPPTAAKTAPERVRRSVDLEALIGGRWLNYVGIIALIFGTAFFLKHAFENDWIGERARILTGAICGGALLVYSRRLLERGYRFFSEGIAGLGAAILFLSIYAGWGFYRLFPQAVAFTGMIAVSGLMVALALIRNSERIGVLALVGGYLTPILLSTGEDRHLVLFTYLLVLNGSLLTLAWGRRWRGLDLLSFFGTQFLFWGWYNSFYNASRLVPTFVFASIYFAQFATLPVIRTIRREPVSGDQIFLILANAFWFLTALHAVLWLDHRWILAAALTALAAAHSVVGRALWSADLKPPPTAGLLYGGLALTFATLVVPVLLRGQWMIIAWAVEGAVLVWGGFYANLRLLRGAGLLLFGLVAFRLAAFPIASGPFLLNARFAAFLVTVLCFAIATWLARPRGDVLDQSEQSLFAAVAVGVNVLALWALSLEFWDLFRRPGIRFTIDRHLAQQLALSLLWTSYAITLMLTGVHRKIKGLRWQGLVLFGVVVVKVFLYDLSFLQQFYRVLSFVVLGLALLITSFLYHRRPLAQNPGEER